MRIVIAVLLAGACCSCGGATELPDPHAPVPEPPAGTVWGPYILYTSPTTATVYWESVAPVAVRVGCGLKGEAPVWTELSAPARQHAAELTGLEVKRLYEVTLETVASGKPRRSEPYPLDTTFNYTLPQVPGVGEVYGDGPKAVLAESAAAQIRAVSGVSRGYCVVLGCGAGELALALARGTQLSIVGVDTDMEAIGTGRRALRAAGVYGERVTLRHVDDLSRTGLTPYFANLVVSAGVLSEGLDDFYASSAAMLVSPAGKLLAGHPDAAAAGITRAVLEAATGGTVVQRDGGLWSVAAGTPFPGAGAWTHQYGDATNRANSGDTLSGAGGTPEMTVQWLGRPGGDFGVDRNPRMPAPLYSSGRLFHQGLNRAIALDAHNGAMLWLAEVPGLRRVNLPRDTGNWCADEDAIYLAVMDQCLRVDGATGMVRQSYGLPDHGPDSPREWGYVARAGELLYGSSEILGSSYREYFGKAAWYDGTTGEGTWKVCSEALRAWDVDSGAVRWAYEGGPIMNPTICIGGGRVMFVECRHPALRKRKTGRIDMPEVWLDQYLVALDAVTGEKRWETPIDTPDGLAVFYGIYSDGRYITQSSADGRYHFHAFSAEDGAALWQAGHAWTADNHSGHMMHAVVVRDRIYVEPMGYDLATGAQVTDGVGLREGCSTYAGTENALIYRGEQRRVAMWDVETEAVTSWSSLRPSCWLSIIPSGGMILAPEGGAGCSCGGWIETSLGFVPRDFLLGSASAAGPVLGE